MADLITNRAKRDMWNGALDLLTDNVHWSLVGASYVQDADDLFMDEAGANEPIDEELSGTGYVAGHGNAGRQALASKAIAQDDANDRAEFDCADVTWSSIDAGDAAKAVVHLKGTSNDTDATIIAVIDSGGFPVTTNGGDFTIQVNAEGLIHLT